MKRMHLLLVLGWACAMPLAAHAQWQWIDRNNNKVFSDTAPPVDVPDSKILRRPTVQAPRGNFTAPPPSDAPAVAAANNRGAAPGAPRPSGVDKDLEAKTREAEEAEKARRAAEEQRVAQVRADNCNRARQGKATFDSGMRVARINDKGEREVLDDQGRAAEQQRIQSTIDSDCK